MHRVGRVALTLGVLIGSSACSQKDWVRGPLPSDRPVGEVIVIGEPPDGLAPTDEHDVQIVYRAGYRLSTEGSVSPEDALASILRHRDEAGIVAILEYASLEPDHEGAERALRRTAASLGADRLIEVGYTLWLGEQHDGGSRIHAWVYHGIVVARSGRDPEPGGER
jgi:hypothetical protein